MNNQDSIRPHSNIGIFRYRICKHELNISLTMIMLFLWEFIFGLCDLTNKPSDYINYVGSLLKLAFTWFCSVWCIPHFMLFLYLFGNCDDTSILMICIQIISIIGTIFIEILTIILILYGIYRNYCLFYEKKLKCNIY